jgi:hypothetical protein
VGYLGILLGFVVRDEVEWVDLRRKVKKVCSLLPLPFGLCTKFHPV